MILSPIPIYNHYRIIKTSAHNFYMHSSPAHHPPLPYPPNSLILPLPLPIYIITPITNTQLSTGTEFSLEFFARPRLTWRQPAVRIRGLMM